MEAGQMAPSSSYNPALEAARKKLLYAIERSRNPTYREIARATGNKLIISRISEHLSGQRALTAEDAELLEKVCLRLLRKQHEGLSQALAAYAPETAA
jgi:hypothetical protein